MGSSQSTPQVMPQRQQSVRPRDTYTSLDEKFDAVRISNVARGVHGSASVLDDDNTSRVSGAKTEAYISALLKDPKNRLGLSALSTNKPSTVLEKPSTVIRDTQTFNVAIPAEGSPVTNQRSSGRCWIFAATNVFRIAIQKKYDVKNFELSQAYLFFWDKVEKSNYYLESIIGLEDDDIDSRLVRSLNSGLISDGGQWDMIVNLVSKYGLVPQTLYPDSWNAMNSSDMDGILKKLLRGGALKLRKMAAKRDSPSDVAAAKEKIMADVIRILTLCLGPPPPAEDKFTWEYYNSKHELKTVSMTPLEFAETTHVKRFFSLINDPRNKYDRLLTVDHLGNEWGGRPITYVNVDMSVLKEASVAMLKKGLPVFFGCDVGQRSDSAKGIMDTDLIDYELGFNIQLDMTKAERLLAGESSMTHAMVLTAVHLGDDGRPLRWRVENSWSDTAGTDGYFVMSDRWMDEFCYQAVVDPSVVSKGVREILNQKPAVLPLWDPMGSLA